MKKSYKEFLKKNRFYLTVLLVLICIFSFCINTDGVKLLNTENVSFLFGCAVIVYLVRYFVYNIQALREAVISICIGFLFSVFIMLGKSYSVNGYVPFGNPGLYIQVIGMMIFLSGTFFFLFSSAIKIKGRVLSFDKTRLSVWFSRQGSKKQYLIILTFCTVLFLPAFLALFPGYLSYDGPIQLDQIYNHDILGQQYNAHHPIAHTMFLKLCFSLGFSVFHSSAAGLLIYTLIQSVLVILILSYAFWFMYQKKVPFAVVLATILFVVGNPIVQVFTFTTAKDTLFAAFFVLILIYAIQIATDSAEFFKKKQNIILFILSCIVMSVMKKQGIYVLLVASPFILWLSRKFIWRALMTIIIPTVSVFLFFGPISNSLNIIPGKPQEMLSVPIQQIMKVVTNEDIELSEKQKEGIGKYIPQDVWNRYIPEISDPIKDNFNYVYYNENKEEFFSLWYSIGKEYSGEYLNAFIDLTQLYWYPDVSVMHDWSKLMAFYSPACFEVTQLSLFPKYRSYLVVSCMNQLSGIPFMSLMTGMYVPVWIQFIVAAVLMIQKKYRYLLSVLMMLAFTGSLILGPVACVRYIYPLLLAYPILVTIVFGKYNAF